MDITKNLNVCMWLAAVHGLGTNKSWSRTIELSNTVLAREQHLSVANTLE